jgi:hypothetical protein
MTLRFVPLDRALDLFFEHVDTMPQPAAAAWQRAKDQALREHMEELTAPRTFIAAAARPASVLPLVLLGAAAIALVAYTHAS